MGRRARTLEQRIARTTQLVDWIARNTPETFSMIEATIESIAAICRRTVKLSDEKG